MGHEIAHVAGRHSTRNATRGEIAQIGLIPMSIAIPTAGRVTLSAKEPAWPFP